MQYTGHVVLTGDRTTGPLHLGHYVGSLRTRLTLQEGNTQFILLTDSQALTDNAERFHLVTENVIEVTLDYLAIGIDPNKSTIFIQSQVPELAELLQLYLNFVTVSRLERNPTIKEEIKARGFGRDIPAGFLTYPVSQAADITAFKATLVPVGEDQAPMIEQTNELVRKVNSLLKRPVLVECESLIPQIGRLPGVDGKAKMSKSLGNVINLSASAQEISKAVHKMYTDPNHLSVSDPGTVEGNVVFLYLDAFDPDPEEVAQLKAAYRRGGLADSVVKKRLEVVLQELLAPIRERRQIFARNKTEVLQVLRSGTEKARSVASQTLAELKRGFGLSYF